MRFFLLTAVSVSLVFAQDPFLQRFEPNLGQYPSNVRFVRRSQHNLLYLTRDSVVLSNQVRFQLAGLDPNAVPEGDAPSSTLFHFYQGRNPSGWKTNLRLFDAIRWTNLYPGVGARFTLGRQDPASPAADVVLGRLLLTIQPGADLARFRLRVRNTGAPAREGPGGIWFFGGRIPGVLSVTVQAVQLDGANRIPLASSLGIQSEDTLSVNMPDRNPALPAEVEIRFPSYDLVRTETTARAADGNRYLTFALDRPTDFGEDGKLDAPACSGRCLDAGVARLDHTGSAVWAGVFGGALEDSVNFATPAGGGVALAGATESDDFPVTANAPHPRPNAKPDVFLALLDRASGLLRNATYAGLDGRAWPLGVAAEAERDLAVGGAYATGPSTVSGYLVRWDPVQNRFVFSRQFAAPIASVAFDANSRLSFAAVENKSAADRMTVGIVDASGAQQGSLVTIETPPETDVISPAEVRLLQAAGADLWVVYRLTGRGVSQPRLMIAKASPMQSREATTRLVASRGHLARTGFTPAGNLKLLVQAPHPAEPTTPDAPLVAACPGTAYFALFSPSTELLQATYVPEPFDFDARNEAAAPAPAAVTCMANAAGRWPQDAAAPGQLITLTGGGFGPAAPKFFPPDAGGMYPVAADGYRVRIGGTDAPIMALARGLIAVQVPYSLDPSAAGPTLEAFENDRPLTRLTLRYATHSFDLFNTGDRDNSMNLPALAALNEDGTVNSKTNPARPGSVVSLFGTGLGRLTPELETGGSSPVPPAGPLSESSLLRACLGCEILYLGSAPGLSTSVVQVNVRLATDSGEPSPGSDVRAHGIAVAVGTNPRNLFLPGPTGVVFTR